MEVKKAHAASGEEIIYGIKREIRRAEREIKTTIMLWSSD